MRQVNIAIFIDYQKPTIKKTRISILSTLHFLFTSRSPDVTRQTSRDFLAR
jgi:hypothetical protein